MCSLFLSLYLTSEGGSPAQTLGEKLLGDSLVEELVLAADCGEQTVDIFRVPPLFPHSRW